MDQIYVGDAGDDGGEEERTSHTQGGLAISPEERMEAWRLLPRDKEMCYKYCVDIASIYNGWQ